MGGELLVNMAVASRRQQDWKLRGQGYLRR